MTCGGFIDRNVPVMTCGGFIDRNVPVMTCGGSVSYTHLTLPTGAECRSRWSPYH